ncbi:MAG TPA: sugar transferase [Anaerolineales bacterium]|nr:sugar transferase [Anaerolineales bacterium]
MFVRLLLLIVFLPALITFISQKVIFVDGNKRPWTYRVSFLIGFCVTAFWIDAISFEPVSAIRLFGIFVGAFAGGLAATALDKGLWERSFPPSPGVEREIRGYHEKVIENLKPADHLKQRFDIVLALTGVIIFAPVFIVLSFLIWFEDPGPIFFIKYSTGKGGFTFPQVKFRSMIQNAEVDTGPVPASVKDPRRLLIGRLIRLLRLDELPQLFNILRGEMSFVGPRPLRAVDVHRFLVELPVFAERHAVLPGIAGLSQAIAGYYISPKDRLYYDLLYIQNYSFLLDTRLLIQSILSIRRNSNSILHSIELHKDKLISMYDIDAEEPTPPAAVREAPERDVHIR